MPLSASRALLSHNQSRLRAPDRWLRLALVLGLLATVLQAPSALSQIQPGASLTVVRGSVAVTRSDGTAIYPAGTGLTLAIGDVVGTLERTRAIVTFFSGSEIELGSNTTVVIRRLDRDLLDQANVTVEHLSGAMLIRVPTEDGPNPGVRVLGNDTVAVIRAGEIGHGVDPTSNNVTVACVDGEWRCSRDSVTFPNATTFLLGQTALTVTGAGDLKPFRVARGASVWDALAEGAALGQPDGTDGASGPVPSQRERDAAEEDDAKPVQPVAANTTPTPTPTPTRTTTVTPTGTLTPIGTLTPSATPLPTATPPPGTPGPQCNTPTGSSGTSGTITTVHNLGRTSGIVRIDFNAQAAADQFEIIYEGVTIFSSGFVPGVGFGLAAFAGTSTFITVRVTTGPGSTVWTYTIACLP